LGGPGVAMQLSQIPYISYVPADGRVLLFQPWYDVREGEWHLYAQIAEGDFIRMQVAGYSAGLYYAAGPADSMDLELRLATLVAQHLSFPGVAPALYSLVDDLNLMCASLEKLRIFWTLRKSNGASTFLVESELEYLFAQTRAMFDVLQKLAKSAARLLQTPDGRNAIATLPDSFASVALSGEEPRTIAELQARFSLPEPLAAFYVSHALRFLRIRAIRVGIEHHGKRVPTVFETERGFGVSTKGSDSWAVLEVWTTHTLLPNSIGSVKALATFLARSFLEALDDFEAALRHIIDPRLLPLPVSAGNKLYLRNPLIAHLSQLPASTDSAWEPAEVAPS